MKHLIAFLSIFLFSVVASAESFILPPPKSHLVCEKFINKYGEIADRCEEVPGPPPGYADGVVKEYEGGPWRSPDYDPNEVVDVYKSEGGWVYVQRRNGKTDIWSETSPGHYEKR